MRGGRREVLAGHLNLSSPVLGQALIYPIWDVDNYAGSKLSLLLMVSSNTKGKTRGGVFYFEKASEVTLL